MDGVNIVESDIVAMKLAIDMYSLLSVLFTMHMPYSAERSDRAIYASSS